MSTINFSELKGYVPGEQFEALVKEIAKKIGLSVSWSGRGPDEGRDMIFTEIRKGIIGNSVVKWLVQCKDFSKSGKSVSEGDVGSISDKIIQHKVDGYLLATSTVVTSGLMKMLESLDISKGGNYLIKVWDYTELTEILCRGEFNIILKQYLPESFKKLTKYDSIEGALDILKSNLSENDYDDISQIIAKAELKKSLPSGSKIWPYSSSSKIIDKINNYLADNNLAEAAHHTPGIEYEAFMLYIDELFNYDSSLALDYLLTIVRNISEQDIIFNCVQYIISHFEITPEVNIEIHSYLDDEGKSLLLDDEIIAFLNEEILLESSKYDFYSYIDSLSTHTSIESVYVEYIDYSTESIEKIIFKGTLSLGLNLHYGSQSESDNFSQSVLCNYEGFISCEGIFLDSVKVDNSEYSKD